MGNILIGIAIGILIADPLTELILFIWYKIRESIKCQTKIK
jgi:hypothetical protein